MSRNTPSYNHLLLQVLARGVHGHCERCRSIRRGCRRVRQRRVRAVQRVSQADRSIPGNHDWYDGLEGFMFNFCWRAVGAPLRGC